MKLTKQTLKRLILQEMVEDNDEMFGKTMAGIGGDGFGADPHNHGTAMDNVRWSLSELQDAKKDLKSGMLASLEYTLNYIEEMLTRAMQELDGHVVTVNKDDLPPRDRSGRRTVRPGRTHQL